MAALSATKRTSSAANPQTAAQRLLNLDGVGVLDFNAKKFAVNLLWLTGDDPNSPFSNAKTLLESRRQTIKPDFMCERSLIIAQHGFGHLSKGHRMGLPVAAAMAADLLVGEWHGIFKADNGWWYVAVHGDAIAPDGDVFFTSEEEAYQHFVTANDSQRWPRAYAPKEWALGGTNNDIDLDKLLNGVPSTFLRPITLNSLFGDTKNKLIFLSLAGSMLVLLVTFLITGMSDYMSPPPPLTRTVSLDVPNEFFAPPRYTDATGSASMLLQINDYPPTVLVHTCLSYFEDMFHALPGWSLKSITCGGGNVSGTWARTTAQLADLPTLRKFFSSDDVTMTYSGTGQLIVSRPLALDDIEKISMQVLKKETLYGMLTRRLESKGELMIEEVTQQQAAPNGDPAQTALAVDTAPERFLSFKFTSPLAGYLWADDFDIPGLKPVELKWSVSESRWEITGLVKFQ